MKIFSIRGFVLTIVVLFSLPFSCTMDEEGCGGAIGKIFVEEIELKAVSAPSTSEYFSERLVEQRIPATQDSLVFQVRTSPGFYAERLPSNSFKIVWGNTLKACSTPPNVNYSNLNTISIAANDTIQTATCQK
jgi:hypothetical protein